MEKDFNLVEVTPFTEEHFQKLRKFENRCLQHVPNWPKEALPLNILLGIKEKYKTREAYEAAYKQFNLIEKNYFVDENNKFEVGCYLEGYTDSKSCRIDLLTLRTNSLKKEKEVELIDKMFLRVLNHCFDDFNMRSVTIPDIFGDAVFNDIKEYVGNPDKYGDTENKKEERIALISGFLEENKTYKGKK